MVIRTLADLEKAVSELPAGETIRIMTLPFTHEAAMRFKHYIQDCVLLPTKKSLEGVKPDLQKMIKRGDFVMSDAEYVKAPSIHSFIEPYEIRIEELETELQQYRIYADSLIKTIQNNICKNFCSGITTSAE